MRRQLAAHAVCRAPTLRLVDHHEAHAAAAAWASGFASCAVLTIDGLGDGLSATISTFRDGRLERVAASPARHSLGVFFEHVTSLLNMRELEDEGKVMALADYAAPIADADNPLLPVGARAGRRDRHATGRACAARRPLARVHWRFPNEQFAYLAQRTVEHAAVALARDAVRLTGCRGSRWPAASSSNVKATRRVRLLPEVEDVFVFPHMGDGGLALGAAVAAAAAVRRAASASISVGLDLGPAYDRPGHRREPARRPASPAIASGNLPAASPSCWRTGRS